MKCKYVPCSIELTDLFDSGDPHLVVGFCPSCKYRCEKCSRFKRSYSRWVEDPADGFCLCGSTKTLIGWVLP
jgi:hypothetical protein